MKEYVELREKAFNNRGPYGTATLFDLDVYKRMIVDQLEREGLITFVNYGNQVVTFDITPEGLKLINKSDEG